MPDLMRALQGNDLGFLRIVASSWGIELTAPDAATALPLLTRALLDPALVQEVVEALPAGARQALQALVEKEGRLPWAQFTRKFGAVREMGAARRDRERPDLQPVSPAEVLYYRALVCKAFMPAKPEPQEFAFIPDDLVELLPPLGAAAEKPPGRPASPAESAHPLPASDRILDHAATLLAALRVGIDLQSLNTAAWDSPPVFLRHLLDAAGLLDRRGAPLPEPVRAFLEMPRPAALALLAARWQASRTINELRLLPGLVCEGEWTNDPLQARQVIMNLASRVPPAAWWSLSAFTAAIKETQPDFQRPAGDYDSWFIRRQGETAYLRGFASWDAVDGALIRFLLTGPLHWLGMLDLATAQPGGEPAAFRLSEWAGALWQGNPPAYAAPEDGKLRLTPDGRLIAPPDLPRSARYQLARFCAWEGETNGAHHYRLTPAALERAGTQGLRPSHLIALLRKYGKEPLPPMLIHALEQWERAGTQARLESVRLLRVSAADILAALGKSRASRWLGETLTPTVVIIRPGGEKAVLEALAELGYLAESNLDADN